MYRLKIIAFILSLAIFMPFTSYAASEMPVPASVKVARPGDGGDGGGVTDTGFFGEYFANSEFSGNPSFTRRDVRIDFDWGTDLPVGGSIAEPYKSFPKDDFSVRWTGTVIPKYSENYLFYVYGDGGVQVWIKSSESSDFGAPIIDNLSSAGQEYAWSKAGTVPMVRGREYDVKVEYREFMGKAGIKHAWSSESTPLEVIDPVMEMGHNVVNWVQAFTDIVKGARTNWDSASNDRKLAMDEDGWPMESGIYYFQESLNAGLGTDPLKTGTVTFSFHGKSDLRVSGNVVGNSLKYTYDEEANITSGTFITKDNGINASYFGFPNSTRDGTPDGPTGITDLKLMAPVQPGADTSYAEDTLFLPEFKELYSKFTVLRVDLNNGGQERDWSERTLPSFFNQNSGKLIPRKYPSASTGDKKNGTSWEYKIMLCNEIGKDLYINIPLLASGRTAEDTQSYVYKLANLIKYGSNGVEPYTSVQKNPVYPPLNPNLRVYIELSNEVWNYYSDAFRQYWDLNEITAADADAQNEDFSIINYDNLTMEKNTDGSYKSLPTWRLRKTALRIVQISNIFRGVFGDGQMMTRIRPIYEWQYANNNSTASTALKFLDNYFNNADGIARTNNPKPVNYYLWGGGGASYYGASNPDGVTDILPNSSFEFPIIEESEGFKSNPTGGNWTFTSMAGIAKNGSDLENPDALSTLGSQVTFIKSVKGEDETIVNGSISIDFTIPEDALDDEVYAVSFKAVNRKKSEAAVADTQKVKVYFDGADICQNSYSQKNGYQPPAYNTGQKWKAQNVSHTWSEYYYTKTFTAAPGTIHTLKFEGISGIEDQMIFIDDVRISSVSAIVNSEMPYKGQATGQTSLGSGYLQDMSVASVWANTYGLKYITYEGGWSLGGDDGGSALQNYTKYRSPKTRQVQIEAIDMFHQAGGKINIYGTYKQWPSWNDNFPEEGMLNIGSYPIMQGIADRFNRLPKETSIGIPVPGKWDGANCLEKSFASGEYSNYSYSSGAITYTICAEKSGIYNVSLNLKTSGEDTELDMQVNQDTIQSIFIPKNPYYQVDNYSDSDAITVNFKEGLNVLRIIPKGATSTNLKSFTASFGPAAARTMKPITLGTGNRNFKLAEKYEIGDIIKLTATDYTFKSATSGLKNIATVQLGTEKVNNDSLIITCEGNGLVAIKAEHTGGTGIAATIFLTVGYDQPKRNSIPIGKPYEKSGTVPMIASSARQNFMHQTLFHNTIRTAVNEALQTVAGLNNQYIVQGFDDLYTIDNLQLYFGSPSTSTSSLLKVPTLFSVEVCSDRSPKGYDSGVTPRFMQTTNGDLTAFYSFSNSGKHFGNGDGIISPAFENLVSGWNWKKIYEGTEAEFITDARDSTYETVIITKEKLLEYMEEKGLRSNERSGYFIKISFNGGYSFKTDLEEDGTDKRNLFALASVMIDAHKPSRESLLKPRIGLGLLSSVDIINAGNAIQGSRLIIGKYDADDVLTDADIFEIGDISANDRTTVPVNVKIDDSNHYKLFLWNCLDTINPIFPVYSSKSD